MGCFTCVMSNVTGNSGNLCNKSPKRLIEQNNSYSDSFNAISGFTSNSRAAGGPVTLIYSNIRTLHLCLYYSLHIAIIFDGELDLN